MRFISLLLVITLGGSFVRADVRIVGSDILGKDFVTALSDFSKRNDLGLILDMQGSRAGMEKLTSGNADLALLVFSPEEKLPEAPYVCMPLAFHTAVVVVPSALPLTQISFKQLNVIYCDDAESNLKRWSDLGVTGKWASRNILPNITGANDGITFDLFRYTVLNVPKLRPTVEVQPSFEDTLVRMRGAEGGLAIMPFLPAAESGLKTLSISRGTQDVAFGPTPENIQTGDYPIRLPVYLVFRKDGVKRVQMLLRYLLSEDAIPLLQGARLVPVPIQVRNQQIFDLEVL